MVLNALQEIVSTEPLAPEKPAYSLGNQGSYTVYPQSEQEIAAVLRYANEQGLTVIPVGGGTKQGFGGLGPRADILLSLSHNSGIIDHSVSDMTMTVRPGTTVREMEEHLVSYRQMLPVDGRWPEYATIGGMINTADSGPKRMSYGSIRDHVIGLRVVYPSGKVIRTGGKVVKNVSGYDMNKLFIGSMGTLGVISEVTVKLKPLPKYEGLVLMTFTGDAPLDAIRSFVVSVLHSELEPVALELLDPTLAGELINKQSYTLAIGFEGREKTVQYQINWLAQKQPKNTEMQQYEQRDAKDWWNHFSHIAPNSQLSDVDNPTKQPVSLKIGSKNMDVLEILSECWRHAREYGLDAVAHGGLGHGINRVHVNGDPEELLLYVKAIRDFIHTKKGYTIIEHMPYELRNRCSVWESIPQYFSIFEGIKRTIDPKGILNPKRFVGGI